MALLGLGLQQWLSKGPATGLAYISSQVSDEAFVSFLILLILRVHALQSWETERHCPHFTPEEYKNETIPVHFGFVFEKTVAGKSRDYHDVIDF